MKILYNPEREKYIKQSQKKDYTLKKNCPFCIKLKEDKDTEHLVLKRYKHVFICMNKYPYNAGHLLIIPYKHEKNIVKLPKNVAHELMEASSDAVDALTQVMKPMGFNLGMNIGKSAGGSLPNHLHMHVLPRFEGDANFLSILSDTKTIFVDIHTLYEKLKAVL